MDKVALALVLTVSLMAATVSAGHGAPAPVVVERTYEAGLVGGIFGVSWADPLFEPVTEDGSVDVAYVVIPIPKPEGATHSPTVQVSLEDRVLDGPVAGALPWCVDPDREHCEDIGPIEFCGTSDVLDVDRVSDSPDYLAVRVYGPYGQPWVCPDSDNKVGGVHGDLTATFSWD